MEVGDVNLTYSTPTNINNFFTFATYLNDLTGGLFWMIVSFITFVFFLITIYVNNNDMINSIIWSSFISLILSILLMSLGIINEILLIIYAVLLGISIVINFISKNG